MNKGGIAAWGCALGAVAAMASGCTTVLDIPEDPVVSTQLNACPEPLKVRILCDLTGPTSELQAAFWAIYDYLREIDGTDAVGGCKLDIEYRNYNYERGLATQIFEEWKARPDWSSVVTILGWGTEDTLALAPYLEDEKKPDISQSYFASLAAPHPIEHTVAITKVGKDFGYNTSDAQKKSEGYPYNFFVGTDYSTGVRAAVEHAKSEGARRMGFFRCNTDYCFGPLDAARSHAIEHGLALGRELELNQREETQATYDEKVMAYFQEEKAHQTADPGYTMVDWIWGANTTNTTAWMAKSIALVNKTLGMNVKLIVNNWGFDETLYSRCGEACIGVYGISPFAAWGDTRAPEMIRVMSLHDKWRQLDAQNPPFRPLAADGGSPPPLPSFKSIRYVQGYATAMVWRKAVERLIAAGRPVTAVGIKEMLETFRNEPTGLTASISFSPTDHRPQVTESIYVIGPDGQLKYIAPDRAVAQKSEYLGW